jgi:hypothetical protein
MYYLVDSENKKISYYVMFWEENENPEGQDF